MQLSAQEEYGLRCLLQVARKEIASVPGDGDDGLLRIPEIAAAEGLSPEYTAKLMRMLRQLGFVTSIRGANGGYRLARRAADVSLWEVLNRIGGPLFSDEFCEAHPGQLKDCVHTTDCAIRSLWRWVGASMQAGLQKVSLADLLQGEQALANILGIAGQDARQSELIQIGGTANIAAENSAAQRGSSL